MCAGSQQLNRKIIKMVLCISLRFKSYLENKKQKQKNKKQKTKQNKNKKILHYLASYLSVIYEARFFWDTRYLKSVWPKRPQFV